MYNGISHLDYCFVKPIKNKSHLSTLKEVEHFGILKYSKEISLRGIMNIPEMNVKQVILDEEIFVVFGVEPDVIFLIVEIVCFLSLKPLFRN